MTETPAETLRRAAEGLNLAAIGAKTSAAGRWYVRTPRGHYPQTICDNGSAVLVADTFEGGPPQLAPFIAAMDPPFAFKVAAMFEAAANLYELDADDGITDGGAMIQQQALAAARSLLREAS